MSPGQDWARLSVPARAEMISLMQQLARELAQRHGLDTAGCFRVELAVEEVVATLLRYAFDAHEQGALSLWAGQAAGMFRVEVGSQGLPFDWSMVPAFDPASLDELEDAEAGLSAFLLKKVVDRYRLVNDGRRGYHFELEWQLADQHIADREAQEEEAAETPQTPVSTIRPLHEREAIELARLVFRSYGYTYVYEDIYYPERIVRNHQQGMLKSWVATTEEGHLVGHLALMKSHADAPAVEWGVAVVDPRWRGGGVMKQLLVTAIDDVAQRGEQVMYAHAVTTHPYTLRACRRYGFEPLALLLCYAPSMQLRQIDTANNERGSTFLAFRCMQPMPKMRLHCPPHYAPVLSRLLDTLAVEAKLESSSSPAPLSERTDFSSTISSSVNVAMVEVARVGRDCAEAIAREQRRLCRERVDAINLMIDLSDPAAPQLIAAAEASGFFLAGLTPMLPYPATLTMQYLNNLKVDYSGIHTDGELASWLKEVIISEQQRVENNQVINSKEKK